jgi:hypothetical protein
MPQITQEELVEINELRDKLATVVSDAGQRTLQVQLLQEDIVRLNTQLGEDSKVFKKLLEDEQALIKRLSDKYGVGDINFETGEFTPEK